MNCYEPVISGEDGLYVPVPWEAAVSFAWYRTPMAPYWRDRSLRNCVSLDFEGEERW